MTNPPKSLSQQWEMAQQAKAHAPATPEISTAAEHDQLVSQREAPKHEMHLRPSGVQQPDHDAAEREARIRQINAALQNSKGKAKEDFEKSH